MSTNDTAAREQGLDLMPRFDANGLITAVVTDAANGEFLLQFTVAETRAWPDKTVLRYEIERWVGSDQESLIFGNINVTQWVNDDADP